MSTTTADPRHTTTTPDGPGPVRLTRRGRLVLLVLFVTVALGLFGLFGGYSAATDEPGAPVETRTVMVSEGDTLWGIAAEIAEPGEVREMVYEIQQLNSLPSAGLQAGQRIEVPVD